MGVAHATSEHQIPLSLHKEPVFNSGNASLSEWHQSEQLSKFLDAMPAGVVLIDRFGIVKNANRQASDMLGSPLLGQNWRDVIARAFERQKDDGYEVSLKDGRKVKLAISRLPDQPGQLIHLTDLTDTRLLQAQVGHMQKLVSLGKMSAGLAHQIRTPLASAMLYAANLKSGMVAPTKVPQFTEKLLKHLKDVEKQVNDMLRFVRKEHNDDKDVFDIIKLINEVAQHNQEKFLGKNRTIEVSHASETKNGVFVEGNANSIKGALQNLINNASESSKDRVQIEVDTMLAGSNQLVIRISDNGEGIPEALMDSLFDPFVTTKSKGTGLGLAVVKSIVEASGGSIDVANRIEGGAEFSIKFQGLVSSAARPLFFAGKSTSHSSNHLKTELNANQEKIHESS
ncbi:MAG: PAS domain-containing protein [Alteromonadaceae bacterium]|nr:PAS domain-containing protein [Alteromonadaceae bacterium]